MKCPFCLSLRSTVEETRRLENTVWRRRSCQGCPHQYWTQESRIDKPPKGIHDLAYKRGLQTRPPRIRRTHHE